MHRPRPRIRPRTVVAAVAAVAALAGLTAACGDNPEELARCTEVYPANEGEPTGPDAIEERGAPDMAACDPDVSDLETIDQFDGTGAEVAAGGTVTAQYTGIVAATGEEFDSSWTSGAPATFPLDGVIQGWSEGLVGMKEGGRRTLVIPADQAYGDNPPAGSGIEPGDTLVFTIDLVKAS